MNFLTKLTQAITLIPFLIQGVENIFGKGNGKNKAEKVIDVFSLTAGVAEAIAQKDIVDQEGFAKHAKDMNDAVIGMLNCSIWHKSKLPNV